MTNRPSRRRLRRRARQLRRDGFQPTMFLGPDQPLPETAGAIVTRALWRYRSELAPIVAAAGIVIAAATLHRSHPGWWPWLMAITLADVAALAVPAPRRLRKEWPILDQDRGARLRRSRLCSDRRMAHGCDCTRPGHATDARPRCHLGPALRRALVGEPSAPRQGPS